MTKKSSMTFRARRTHQMNVNVINFENRFKMRHARINELMNKSFSYTNYIRIDIYAVVMMMIVIVVKMLIIAIVLRFNAFL